MPAHSLMAWEPKARRWWKQHHGKRYVISCRQLRELGYECGDTKESSYQAANGWWKSRVADLGGQPEPHRHAAILAELDRRIERARGLGRKDEAKEWAGKKAALYDLSEAEEVEVIPESFLLSEAAKERREVFRVLGQHDADPIVAEALYGDDLDDIPTDAIPADETLQGLSERYLSIFIARHRAQNLSAAEVDTTRQMIGKFTGFVGKDRPATLIDAQRWEGYWAYLMSRIGDGEISPITAKKSMDYARRFVSWLGSVGIITLPGNLEHKGYKFPVGPKTIPTFSVDEAVKLVEAAPGQLKLHLMLMLNCGFNQTDIADLAHEEVDYEVGKITRQRSKTRQHHGDTVPTVTWTLWPKTAELLREYKSDHPKLALVNGKGETWVEEALKDGKRKRRDGIDANFRHIRTRLKIDKPLKVFRKTAATMLDKSELYGRYAQFFLGHAPESVASKHYVVPSQEQFDKAIAWLGIEFGFVV